MFYFIMNRDYLYSIFTVLFLAAIAFFVFSQRTENISDCRVIDLQSEYNGQNVTYFVICEKETFKTSMRVFGNEYPNSDIFLHLEKGAKYDFKVNGLGLNVFGLHRNIVSFYEKDVTISE